MSHFTKQQLDNQLKKLPEDLKDAVFSVDIATKMFDIGRNSALTIEKTGFLAEETGYVMLGLTKPEEFVKNLETRLDLDEEEAADLAQKINKEIFYPIREAMKRAHQFEIKDGEEALSLAPKPSFSKIAQELREEVKKEFPNGERTHAAEKKAETTIPGPVRPAPVSQSPETVNPIRTGASQSTDGGITPPSALPIFTTDRSQRSSNGVKRWPEETDRNLAAKMVPNLPATAGNKAENTPKALESKTSAPAAPAPSAKLGEPEKKFASELFTQKPISRDTFAIKKDVKPEAQPGTITSPKLEPRSFIPPPPRPLPHQEERRPMAPIVRPVTEDKKVPTPPPAPLPSPPAPPSKISQKPMNTVVPPNQTFGVGETKPDIRPPRPPSPLSFTEPKTSDLVRDSGAGLAIAEKTFPPESIRPPAEWPREDLGLSAPPSPPPTKPHFPPLETPLPKVLETKKEAPPISPPSQGKQNYIAKDPYREAVE